MPAPKTVLTNAVVEQMVAQGLIDPKTAAELDTVEKQAARADKREQEAKEQKERDEVLASFTDEFALMAESITATPEIVGEKWSGWVARLDIPGLKYRDKDSVKFRVKVVFTPTK